jgi:prepilin-type N-terminal cleavage/methylation domain-containing protein
MCINTKITARQAQPQTAPLNQAAGFTIIEVMIAIVVLTFGLVSLMGVSVYVSKANNTSNALNVLAAAGQDQVDRLRSAVWTHATEDGQVAVGGSLSGSNSSSSSGTTPYVYTLDPSDAHHATVSNTPIGDLSIRWQVRQGGMADLRYVTIKVVQVIPSPGMRDGFTVSTILARQD